MLVVLLLLAQTIIMIMILVLYSDINYVVRLKYESTHNCVIGICSVAISILYYNFFCYKARYSDRTNILDLYASIDPT